MDNKLRTKEICEPCAAILERISTFPEFRSLEPPLNHHNSYQALANSSEAGCWICQYLQTAVIEETSSLYSKTESEAVEFHLLLDEIEATGFTIFFKTTEPVSQPRGYTGFSYIRTKRSEEGGPFRFELREDLPHKTKFNICSISGQHPTVRGRVVSRERDLALCASWITTCSLKHGTCGHVSETDMPSRLLDIGCSEVDCDDIRLVETTGQHGYYATLSHCWSASNPLVTNSHNFNAHLYRIAFTALPKTFQDAVIVTRRMGLKYLWIDSLCIIQDSRNDWERECAQMDGIFENSAFTIASLAASSPHDGFLNKHVRRTLVDCTLPDSEQTDICDSDLRLCQAPNIDPSIGSPKEWRSPLNGRAWVLQERLLSPRVILFGNYEMYFECRSDSWFESRWTPYKSLEYERIGYIEKRELVLDSSSNEVLYPIWNRMVDHYSRCQLTKISDTLPALSGLAKRFGQRTGHKYLAGIWCQNLHNGLLWSVSEPHEPRSHQSRTHDYQEYVAPSWSWASFNGRSHQNWHDGIIDIDVLRAEVDGVGLDRFGQVKGGSLTVMGRLRKFHMCYNAFHDRFASVPGLPNITLTRDYKKSSGNGEDKREEKVTCLLVQRGGCHSSSDYIDSHPWMALALERVVVGDDNEVFRRVGVVIRSAGNAESCKDSADCCTASWDNHYTEWRGVIPREITII